MAEVDHVKESLTLSNEFLFVANEWLPYARDSLGLKRRDALAIEIGAAYLLLLNLIRSHADSVTRRSVLRMYSDMMREVSTVCMIAKGDR